MRNRYFIILLIAAGLFLFFYGLGNMALTDPDESFYAETGREMIERNEWVTPYIFGQPQFEKPIFYYWLVLASYKVFGINEFAARVPSAVFGILGIIGIFYLGKLLFSGISGFFSGLVMATCIQYIILARACITDIVLMVCILYCMLFFIAGWMSGNKRHYYISAVMAALAVLTKGPIGLFICGGIILLYVIFTRQWKELKKIPILKCILVFLVISLPWYIAVTKIHGNAFIGEFFGFHNITRFLEAEHRIGVSPFFYIPVVLGGFFPWSFFLPLGSWYMFRKETAVSLFKGYKVFLGVWFLLVFLFFSASSTKLVTYIFPLFPVLAIVIGRLWERFCSREKSPGYLDKYMAVSFYVFITASLTAMIGLYFFVRYKYGSMVQGIVPSQVVFALGLIISAILFRARRGTAAFILLNLAVVLLIVPVVSGVSPLIAEFESSKAITHKAVELAGRDAPLGGECDHRRGVAFYSARTDIVDIHPWYEFNRFISRKEKVWGIVQRKHYEQLRESRPDDISEPLFKSGKYVLVTNKKAVQPTDNK
ncbi:MAG: glycosyltransferase family 39 protein [Candidatus Omnitrophota bacterium]